MAGEISLVCNFIFSSIHTSLPTDTVGVELTIRRVKGICTKPQGPYYGINYIYPMEQKCHAFSFTTMQNTSI